MKNLSFTETLKQYQKQAGLDGITTMKGQVPKELKEYANKMAEIANTVEITKLVTPVNREKMRKLWLENMDSVPEFEYDDDLLMRTSYVAKDLKELGHPPIIEGRIANAVREVLMNRYTDTMASAELAEGMLNYDAHMARHAIEKKYGALTEETIELAEKHAYDLLDGKIKSDRAEKPELSDDEIQELKDTRFNAESIKEWLNWALKQYGFEETWRAQVDETAPEVTVFNKQHVVLIPSTLEVDGIHLLQMIGHEIECHVRDSMNGEALFGVVGGGALKTEYNVLSEGHALISDLTFYNRYLGEARKCPAPWYVLAIDMAKNGEGFNRVARKLHELYLSRLEPEAQARRDAWKYTYAVYRGTQDTTPARGHKNVFTFTKDKCYFEGYPLAKAMIKAGLGHWLEIGIFRPMELLTIASTVRITSHDIPYQKLDVVEMAMDKLLYK